jgi:hypothetical protein
MPRFEFQGRQGVPQDDVLSAHRLEPATGGFNVTEHLDLGSSVLGQDGIHSCHTEYHVIGRHDGGGSERRAPKRICRPLNKRPHLRRRQVRRRSTRIEELRELQSVVALLIVEVLAELLEGHETIGVSQHALADPVDDVADGHGVRL